MNINIYGADINFDDKKFNNVGKIIDFLESENYIVMKVVADEREIIAEDDISELKPIEKLEIYTKSEKELVIDSLTEAESYIPRLLEGINKIVVYFTRGNGVEGYNLLNQGLEGFQWLNQLLIYMQKLNIEIENLEKVSFRWKTNLEELLSAMENRDSVLLADLLEYEFGPILKDYLELIKKTKEKLSE